MLASRSGRGAEAGFRICEGPSPAGRGGDTVPPSCDHDVMAMQLALRFEPPDEDWHLDEHTREVGRRGVIEARRTLAEVTNRHAA